jgi:hypothetical protein
VVSTTSTLPFDERDRLSQTAMDAPSRKKAAEPPTSMGTIGTDEPSGSVSSPDGLRAVVIVGCRQLAAVLAAGLVP